MYLFIILVVLLMSLFSKCLKDGDGEAIPCPNCQRKKGVNVKIFINMECKDALFKAAMRIFSFDKTHCD